MKTNQNAFKLVNPGLLALNTVEECNEISVALGRPIVRTKLQYLMGSRQKGLRLWNVLAPNLKGYPPSGGVNGYPTFSISGLQQNGLI